MVILKCFSSILCMLHTYKPSPWITLSIKKTASISLDINSSIAARSVCFACDRGSLATFLMVSHRMGDQNSLSRSPLCFGRHVKPLVPVAFAVVSTRSRFKDVWGQAGGRKTNCRIFITTWWKTCCTDPTSWNKGRQEEVNKRMLD
jgi:hypothetical protein